MSEFLCLLAFVGAAFIEDFVDFILRTIKNRRGCPNCKSEFPAIRLCLQCRGAHSIDLPSNRGHEKIPCNHLWHEGNPA